MAGAGDCTLGAMRRITLFLLAAAIALPLWATGQAPEVLRFETQTYSLFTNPLEPYLRAHPQALPKPAVMNSGLWRGYIGTWGIRDGKLFLDDVRMLTAGDKDRSVMTSLFPDGKAHVATWFTGNLVVPTGKLVNYVHMGYGSTYSSYMIATVADGQVQKIRNLNQLEFEDFRRAQFAAYKKTQEYRDEAAELKKGEKDGGDEMLDKFIYEFSSEVYLSRIFPPP